jgi:DNA polymerase/3'-5' exonuclease PolX
MNKNVIGLLDELRNISNILGQIYREKAYRIAIVNIRQLPWDIKDNLGRFKDSKIVGVGSAIKEKIMEICKTGKLKELDQLRRDPEVIAAKELSRILGVGPATVKKWLSLGINSLADLCRRVNSGEIVLGNVQRVGLQYYVDLNTKIPRAEVSKIGATIHEMLTRICPGILFCIAGSYRREFAESGDVDILISCGRRSPLAVFISVLETDPRLITILSRGPERVTFLYKIGARVRQVDILSLVKSSWATGILYFTGSWEFNEGMRGYAKAQGYRLNQSGLFKITKNGNLSRINVSTEEDIFHKLNIPYVQPRARDIFRL